MLPGAATALHLSGPGPFAWVDDLEKRFFYDPRLAAAGPHPPTGAVVVIPMDDAATRRFGRWPWSRTVFAELIRRVAADHPKVIALDVTFSTLSGSTAADGRADQAFADAVRAVRAQGVKIDIALDATVDDTTGDINTRPLYPALAEALAIHRHNRPGLPVRQGYVNMSPDRDSVVRQVWLLRRFPNEAGLPFPREAFAVKVFGDFGPDGIIPADARNEPLYINYTGRDFTRVPFAAAHDGAFPPGTFRDKIALVYSATEPRDQFLTPVAKPNRGTTIPGGEIHANVLDNLISGAMIRRASAGENFLVSAATVGIATLCLATLPFRAGLLGVILAALAEAGLAWALFSGSRLWVNVAQPWVLLVILTLLVLFLELRRIRGIFAQFVPQSLVDQVLTHDRSMDLGGAAADATVLFSDIRGFSTLAEKTNPQVVMDMLNEYHTAMGRIFTRHGGTVADYQGDAQMVLFGAPKPLGDHAGAAVAAASDMLAALAALQRDWAARGRPTFEIGVGICTGTIAYGLVGQADHKQFTAIGDVPNVAARLQALSREQDVPIWMNEETYHRVQDRVETKTLEGILLKGRSEASRVYGLVQWKGPSGT